MSQVSHQTVKLGKGKHQTPHQGACVMELASMLAGEPFSDHPRSVSAPIASFLRRYNDLLDERRRQDLYPYAARVVGTVASPDVELARTERLLAWADEQWERRRWPARCRLIAVRRGRSRVSHPEVAGSYAVRALPRMCDQTHTQALDLVDELIGFGTERAHDAKAEPPARELSGQSV